MVNTLSIFEKTESIGIYSVATGIVFGGAVCALKGIGSGGSTLYEILGSWKGWKLDYKQSETVPTGNVYVKTTKDPDSKNPTAIEEQTIKMTRGERDFNKIMIGSAQAVLGSLLVLVGLHSSEFLKGCLGK